MTEFFSNCKTNKSNGKKIESTEVIGTGEAESDT
jgi:hypothetical protein